MRSVIIVALALSALVSLQAQQAFSRGEQVRVKPPAAPSDPPSSGITLAVVGVPGDRLRVDPQIPAVLVNDQPVEGFLPLSWDESLPCRVESHQSFQKATTS